MLNQPASFNGRVPRELKMFIEMILGVYYQYQDVSWSKNSDYEIGFYYRNKLKGTECFFGIWYDLWEKFDIPLCMTLGYKGKAPIEWHHKLKKYIEVNYPHGIQIKMFEDYTCILFEYSFFKFDKGDDIETLSNLYYKMSEFADAQNDIK